MPEVKRTSILEAADRLATELKALPADERRDKALYHLQRLQLSVNASHSEAVRFAAFTVNKLVHDAAAEWGARVTSAMETLKRELHENGHEF